MEQLPITGVFYLDAANDSPCHEPHERQEDTMLGWALTFFVIAIVAAVFGFGGIAAGAAGIAKILFFIFVVLFVLAMVARALRGRPPV